MPEGIEDGKPGQIEIWQGAEVDKERVHDPIDCAKCTVTQYGIEGKEQTRKGCTLDEQWSKRGREGEAVIFVEYPLCLSSTLVVISIPAFNLCQLWLESLGCSCHLKLFPGKWEGRQ